MDTTLKKDTGFHGPFMVLAVALVSLLLHGLYYDVGVKNLIDLGVLAVDSERVMNGQLFGREFIAPYGPGRYYLTAALFQLFGPSMSVLCGIFLVLRVVVDVATFLVARRLLPPFPALAAVLCVAVLHGPTHKGFLTAGLILINLAAAFAVCKPSPGRSFLFGLVVGTAALFRYDLGLVGLAVAAVVLITGPTEKRNLLGRIGTVLLGILLGFLPGICLIAAGDPLRLLHLELSRAFILSEATAPKMALFSQLNGWSKPAGALLAIVLLLAPIVLLSYYLRNRKKEGSIEERIQRTLWLALCISGILLFSQVIIEPKINRLLQVGPPLFLCAFFLARYLSRFMWNFCWLSLALLGLAGWYGVSESGTGSIDSPAVLLRHQRVVEGARAGFSAPPGLAQGLQPVLDWAEKQGEKTVFFVSPTQPLLYFLTGRSNPTPFTDFTYFLRNRMAQNWMLAELQEKEVAAYIRKPEIVQGFDPEKEAPILFNGLRARFPLRIQLPRGYEILSNR